MPATDPPPTTHADHVNSAPAGATAARHIATLEGLLALDAPTVRAALDQAVDLIAAALATDKIDCFLYDADADALVALGVSDTAMGQHERALGLDRLSLSGGGRHAAVYRTGVPYTTGRLDQDAEERPGFARDLGVRSVITVPLEVAGERRGVFGAMSARPEGYTPDDARFLEAIAHWLGLLIGRAEADEARHTAVATVATLRQRARQAEVVAEIGVALTGGAMLPEQLQRCAEALVRHLDAAFARVWTLDEADRVLTLRASAGLYTHLDGAHGRVPVGAFTIGRIAAERRPHLTNAVVGDPEVNDQEWAVRVGMVAFAGYPLVVADRLVGVMALFARQPLTEDTVAALGAVADAVALGIARAGADDERARLLERERAAREESDTIHRVGQLLAAELDQEALVQAVTDAATELTGAAFGAFFYNVRDARGDRYTLYALAGVPRAAFARFPMPRATAIFGPTFQGEGSVRLDDVRVDGRFGRNAPYHGLPPGHLPVVSYLAVPVISRSGDVIGGLFFGHPEAGRFSARDERVIAGLAAQTAIAMDNARLYREARAALALRNDFLTVAAHDLRSPLTNMLGRVQLVQARARRGRDIDAAWLATQLASLTASTTRLLATVDELNDMARVEMGEALDLDVEDMDLGALTRAVADEVAAGSGAQSLGARTVEVVAPGPPGTPVVVAGDRGRLARVLQNVVGNAVKYSPSGAPVRVEVRAEGAGAVVVARDQGVGIPAADLPRIFERFFRASTARGIKGSGIGLSGAKAIVEQLGGTIAVESAEGRGTTVTITLPRVPTEASDRPVEEGGR